MRRLFNRLFSEQKKTHSQWHLNFECYNDYKHERKPYYISLQRKCPILRYKLNVNLQPSLQKTMPAHLTSIQHTGSNHKKSQ